MLQQLLLFTTSIALGSVLGGIYFLLNLLAKSTKLKAMNYIFDIIWCGIAFSGFSVLTIFLASGTFHMFTLLGMLAGLGISAIIFSKTKKLKNRKENENKYKASSQKKDTV
ncbi:MAG: hypothetical protein FWE13_05850 [Firmicutes bacterium]|nr:hypothetical protein [Bacillota bacterium]